MNYLLNNNMLGVRKSGSKEQALYPLTPLPLISGAGIYITDELYLLMENSYLETPALMDKPAVS